MGKEPVEEQEQTETAYKTQEDVDRIVESRLSRERKKIEKEFASRPTQQAFDELKAQLAELSELQDLGGKTHMEKLQHQQSKAIETFNRQRSELEKKLADYEGKLAQAEKALSDERRNQILSEALAKKGVFPAAAKDALRTLTLDLQDVELLEKGGLRASYGQLSNAEPDKIAEAFLSEKPFFSKAQTGGAGTKGSNGVPSPKDISDMSFDQVISIAAQMPDPNT